jgi:serine/threonine-protein kinase
MHRASLVHRDLKPENIFLAEREEGPARVKLLDFGVAKVVAEGASAARGTEVVGTPTYMAPEQFRTGERITGAADVYALGLTAYTLIVGAPYWHDESIAGNAFAVAMSAAHGTAEPASVRAARRGVQLPSGFDPWFATVTAVDPARRYATAAAAVRALAEVFAVGVPLTSTTEGMKAVVPPESARAPVSVPSPTSGLPSYSATVRHPVSAWRPALLAVAFMAAGGCVAAVILTVGWRGAASRGGDESQARAAAATAAAGTAALDAGPPEQASPVASTEVPSVLPAARATAATTASAALPSAQAPAVPRGTSAAKSLPKPRPTAVYSRE